MDSSEEGCDQSYCSMNNVLNKCFVFSKGKVKTNVDFLLKETKRVFKASKIGRLFSVNVGCSTPAFPTGCVYFFYSRQLVKWSNLE